MELTVPGGIVVGGGEVGACEVDGIAGVGVGKEGLGAGADFPAGTGVAFASGPPRRASEREKCAPVRRDLREARFDLLELRVGERLCAGEERRGR